MQQGWNTLTASILGLFCSTVLGLTVGTVPARAAEGTSVCRIAPSAPTAVISAVVDGRTLRLADGSEVRLLGLADLVDAGEAAQAAIASVQAKAALERLAFGGTVAVESFGEDRYGRRIALVGLADDRAGPSLQERLIAGGNGLVAGVFGYAECASRFLATERRARAARLGLWAVRHYLILEADRPPRVAQARGRFALVEGKVLSVNDRGATVYVNFGRRWSEDFTVTIAKRNVRNFNNAGLDPQSLAGRRVRIRGWLDERGGPWIEAIGPEQVEFIDTN